MTDETTSAADFGGDDLLGLLYHVMVDAAGDLDDLAGAVKHADSTDPRVCAALREAWDAIMARMGRCEQLLAALPMPERGADDDG